MNGQAYTLPERASPLAHYPHMRAAGGFLFVSGISARRPDGGVEGVARMPDGTVRRDVRAQTKAVLENIRAILQAAGADLGHVVDLTAFLVDMADYGGFNEVYNTYFDAETGPSRTTVGVQQLPGPDLLIEIKVVALAPQEAKAHAP